MPRRTTSLLTPVAHLVGPGKIKVVNGRLAFSTGKGTPVRLDAAALRTLLCYGEVGVSDEALALLFAHDVQVSWLTPAGQRLRGRLVRSGSAETLLRLQQQRVALDPAARLQIAREWVADKIASQLAAVEHYGRHGAAGARDTAAVLRQSLRTCRTARDLDALRGVEGSASAAWFALLGRLLRSPWHFGARVRRPPTDPVNALLSLGYTWLTTRAAARCEAMGLEVALGCLHDYRPGRPSLACDVVEPLRVPAVDRWVIGLCNQGPLAPADFLHAPAGTGARDDGAPANRAADNAPAGTSSGDGGVRLQPQAFGRILQAFERHWQERSMDKVLGAVLQRVTGLIRRHGAAPSTPSDPGVVSRGPGEPASVEDDEA